jgi:CubicO group peptidase (beta-lactamase class C family)
MRKIAMIACTLCASAWALPGGAQDVDAGAVRIERVENGLRTPVAVRGEAVRTMRLAERMRALHVPGVSIAVIDQGKIAWTRAYGLSDADSGRPVTPDTLFQAASISKPVTAVATLKLAAMGQVDLDENVNRRLRAWRMADSALTARQPVTPRALLSHTAGLSEYNLPGHDPAACPSLVQVLRGDAPSGNAPVAVEAVPGSRYAYSSLGYAVLEQYLDDATGRPFDVLAHDSVLAPVGMRDSLYAASLPAALAQRAASGHGLDGRVMAGRWRCHPEQAAAGLWTTAADLARFAIALQEAVQGRNAGFLSRRQAAELLTPVRNDYGLGFELDHQGKRRAFHHSGSNAGYKALMFGYADGGQGAVILTNGDGGWMLIEELMRSIAAEYGWEDYRPVERTAAPANTALFDRFTGAFAVGNVVLHVERRGARLVLAGPPLGPDPVELVPAGDYDYFVREKDATLHFDANSGANGGANGDAPVQTLTFVDGRPRPGKRVDGAAR